MYIQYNINMNKNKFNYVSHDERVFRKFYEQVNVQIKLYWGDLYKRFSLS